MCARRGARTCRPRAHGARAAPAQARTAARKYARIIQKLDYPARFTEFKIQNMVGSCDVKFPVRLEGLAYKHSHYSSVRPPRAAPHRPLSPRACAPRARSPR